MTEVTTISTPTDDTSSIVTAAIEPKLWAGKYKSPEDLEAAYNNSAKVFQKNQELEKELERYSKVPDDYSVPESIKLRQNDISEIKQLARESKLNQEQFERLTAQMSLKVTSQLEQFDKAKQEVGEKNLTVLSDYVKKHYPEKLHETVLTKLIKDKSAMEDAMKHRDQLLNTQAPGISRATTAAPERYDGDRELQTLAREYERTHNPKIRDKMIDVARQVAEARNR
jgi:hypothetical protein